MSAHARCLLHPLLLLLALPLPAWSQQTSDPNFDAKVAQPMFKSRHPMLLFDQGHNNTHTTRSKYDGLSRLAMSDGFMVAAEASDLSVDYLQAADVLAIVNPLGSSRIQSAAASTTAFTPEECDAVFAWVRSGGSLLLIAEHAPMGTAARALAARFGVDFSGGYLVDPAIADTAFGASTLVFSSTTGTLGDHVIIRGRGPAERVRRVRTYTGQSMAGPPGSVALLKVTDHAQDLLLGPGGVRGGTIPDNLKHSAAGRAQAIAFTVGKGRVVMVGETTIFAAQLVPGPHGEMRKVGMNSEGFDNRRLALNILRWLAHGLS